jgi:LysM repeat protein
METRASQLSVRLLVLLLAIFMVFLLIDRPAEAEAPATTVGYVVQSGDTLWEIARSTSADEADLRRVVQAIQDLNNLTSAVIQPGQLLVVPQTR